MLSDGGFSGSLARARLRAAGAALASVPLATRYESRVPARFHTAPAQDPRRPLACAPGLGRDRQV